MNILWVLWDDDNTKFLAHFIFDSVNTFNGKIHLSLDLSEQWVPENPRINRIRTNRGYIYVVMCSKAMNLNQNNQILMTILAKITCQILFKFKIR